MSDKFFSQSAKFTLVNLLRLFIVAHLVLKFNGANSIIIGLISPGTSSWMVEPYLKRTYLTPRPIFFFTIIMILPSVTFQCLTIVSVRKFLFYSNLNLIQAFLLEICSWKVLKQLVTVLGFRTPSHTVHLEIIKSPISNFFF